MAMFAPYRQIVNVLVTVLCLAQAATGLPAFAESQSTPAANKDAVLFLWNKFERVGGDAFKEGKIEESEELYKKALEEAKFLKDEHLPQTLDDLGRLYQSQDKLSDAEVAFSKSLEFRRGLGQSKKEIDLSVGNLCYIYLREDKAAQAEQLLVPAANDCVNKFEPGSCANTFLLLSVVYLSENKYKDAQPLLDKLLSVDSKTLADNSQAADILESCAQLLIENNQAEQAQVTLNKVIELRRLTVSPNDPAFASTLTMLARSLQAQGKYSEALSLYKDALAIYQTSTGVEHAHVANILSNMSVLYEVQGKYQEAKPLLVSVLQNDQKILGPYHPMVAADLANLASVHEKLGELSEAKIMYKEALDTLKKLGKEKTSDYVKINTAYEALVKNTPTEQPAK
jgi:tetratricopeptide (TPR) repeat protein